MTVIDPKMQEKVQQNLRSTLSGAEELVVEVAEKVAMKTTLFRESLLSKCNGNGRKPAPSTPPTSG